jgi:hypothetical protein
MLLCVIKCSPGAVYCAYELTLLNSALSKEKVSIEECPPPPIKWRREKGRILKDKMRKDIKRRRVE